MANIANLPETAALLRRPVGFTTAYGPRDLKVTVGDLGNEKVVTLTTIPTGIVLAEVGEGGGINVQHSVLDPITVPYVNRLILASGKVIYKNHRSGLYETKLRQGKSRAKARRAASAATLTVTADETATAKAVGGEGKGAVITITAEQNSVLGTIPGMKFFPKEPLKGAGRGYTNVGGIILPNDQLRELQDAWEMAQDGEVAAALITGPAGTAKTMVVQGFAKSLGVPYLKVDGGTIRTADDWSVAPHQDPVTKVWDYRWSPFAQALRAKVPCIIHVDELTRTETPAALNALMGMLDETGTMLVPDKQTTLDMPPGILVVATANIGPEFVGTVPLDGAIRQRFPNGFRMSPPPEEQEITLLIQRTGILRDVAERLVRIAIQQRMHRDDAQLYPSGAVISTRVLLSAARKIAKGRDPRVAIRFALETQFDPIEDGQLSILIDSQFPKGWQPSAPASGGTNPATIVAGKHYYVPGGAPGSPECQFGNPDGTPCHQHPTDAVHLTK